MKYNWEQFILIILCIFASLSTFFLVAQHRSIQNLEDRLTQLSMPMPVSESGEVLPADTPSVAPHDIVTQFLIRDESIRKTPYLDSRGNPTIGVGRNLNGLGVSIEELHAIMETVDYQHILKHARIHDGRLYCQTLEIANRIFSEPITNEAIELLLQDDIERVETELKPIFPNYEQIDPVRQAVIVDMLFNLGLPTFKEFKNFIAAVNRSDWNAAATEMLNSLAAHQDVVRYHRNSLILRTGKN